LFVIVFFFLYHAFPTCLSAAGAGDVVGASSLGTALQLLCSHPSVRNVFVIGGGEVYKHALSRENRRHCEAIILSVVDDSKIPEGTEFDTWLEP
jgi:dihydrofolate reductase